ncbi:hypothetical protein EPN96_11800 [bacterium]|nr:MAG: hypothetical protein EPN96_11800 [bacterium]
MKTARFLLASSLGELAALDEPGYSGVNFGAEFCPMKLPSGEEVKKARILCAGRGLSFSLVTPLARQAHFPLVTSWLTELLVKGEEWVANDWGVLHFASGRGTANPVTAGRLLSRQRRDSRCLDMLLGASEEEARGISGSLWDDEDSVKLAVKLGVTRFELDPVFQGVHRPSLPEGAKVSICAPYFPATVALACPYSENILKDPLGCGRVCRKYPPATVTNLQRPEPLYSSGNALFFLSGEAHAQKCAETAGADRLVWAKNIPA